MSLIHTHTMRETHFLSDLLSILGDSMRPTQLITVLFMWFTAAGMLVQSFGHPINDLVFILALQPWWVWSIMLVGLGASRMISLFHRPIKFLQYANPILAIWFWSMLFASAAILTPMSGFSVLYIIMITIEVWILARTVSCWGIAMERRKNIKERRG